MVLAIDGDYADLSVRDAAAKEMSKVFPMWPRVAKVFPSRRRSLEGTPLAASHALFAFEESPSGASPAVSRFAIGKGDVILLSCPEIFQNSWIGQADHLALLEALAGSGRPVFFDEFVHGFESRAGTTEILKGWGLGPLLGLAVLTSGIAFWRRRARVGPEEDDHRETRIEAIDFVDSLALLYNRALQRRQALALYSQTFVKAVSLQTGLKGKALEARARELLGKDPVLRSTEKRDLSAPDFQRELKTINEAFRRLEDAKRPGSRRKVEEAGRTA